MELTEQKNKVFEVGGFDEAQRVAKALASSKMVPKEYQNDLGSCLVALDVAIRTGFSPLMVMQNLHLIHGRPSWSSSFIAAAIRSCGRFEAVELVMSDKKDSCFMQAVEKSTGKTIVGPTVTLQMAQQEGWASKPGSKWKTMPEMMLQYRATSFFGRLHASDVLMGMHSDDEVAEKATVSIPDTVQIEAQPEAKNALPINKQKDHEKPKNNDAPEGGSSFSRKIWGAAHEDIPNEVIDAVAKIAESEGVETTEESIKDGLRGLWSNGSTGVNVPTKTNFDRKFGIILDAVEVK